MTTEAQIGSGSEFWLDNASGTLTELDEIISISLPNPQANVVDATHMKSPGRRREYIAGLIDDGEGQITLNYVPGSDTDVLLRAAQNDGVTRSYKFVIPDGAGTWEITGDCVVTGYERAVPLDDRMTAVLTVRFTGDTAEAAGA